MAAAVLGTSVDDIDAQIESGESTSEPVKSEVPVYLAYFTAWPDSDGRVQYYQDVYGRDAHLVAAMERAEASRGAGAR